MKEHGNKTKTKKAVAPLVARFEKANPPRSAQDSKAKWHSLRSSVLRYLKKQKEEEDIEIKWPFWEDLNFKIRTRIILWGPVLVKITFIIFTDFQLHAHVQDFQDFLGVPLDDHVSH